MSFLNIFLVRRTKRFEQFLNPTPFFKVSVIARIWIAISRYQLLAALNIGKRFVSRFLKNF